MSDAADSAALEQRFAERLLDDEGLRGDLTDDEFLPLQDWALARLHERTAALADPSAPEAETEMESLVASLRAVLRTANDAIGQRYDLDEQGFADRLEGIYEAIGPPLFAAEGPADNVRLAVEAVIPRLAARKDEAEGYALVEELVAALSETHGGATADAEADEAAHGPGAEEESA